MAVLQTALNVFLWPGNRFCAWLDTSPADDSGMLRGFINSVVWGVIVAIVLLEIWL